MFWAVLALIGMGMGTAFSIPPISQALQNVAWRLQPNKPVDVGVIAELYRRKEISLDEAKDYLLTLGYDKDNAEKILKTTKQLLSLSEVIAYYWRSKKTDNPMSDKELEQYLSRLGYTKEDIQKIKTIAEYYPSVTDFIRFAVRDVFDKESVEKYNLDAEFEKKFPEDIMNKIKAAGVDEEVLKWYWRAHWELPSPEMVIRFYNMFYPDILETELPDGRKYGEKYNKYLPEGMTYKDIITDDKTVDEYLAMADISPFWRARFKAATYPPITRVDLRRIYALGLISDAELIARLMQLGYAKEDAELLAKFYKKYKNAQGYELTRTQILDAYRHKLIDENEAKQLLQQIGYDEDEAEFIISLEQKRVEDEILDEQLTILRRKYVKGEITKDELKAEVEKLDIPLIKQEYELERAERERASTIKLPSKTDLLKWLEQKIITEEQFKDLMKQIGYSDKFIEYYVKAAKGGGS